MGTNQVRPFKGLCEYWEENPGEETGSINKIRGKQSKKLLPVDGCNEFGTKVGGTMSRAAETRALHIHVGGPEELSELTPPPTECVPFSRGPQRAP